MANLVLHSPKNPHFFQPLLPGFHTHLNIPLKFFSKYIQGRRNKKNLVELTSDACEKTWKVKMEGRKLTSGWKDFADAHDFRIGDIVVFRHEGDFVFHITGLGPSCCEIQYVHPSSNNHDDNDNDDDKQEEENIRKHNLKKELEDEEKDNMAKLQRKKQEKKRVHETEAESNLREDTKHCSKWKKICTESSQRVASSSSLSENRFVTLTVTPSGLKDCRLYLPLRFTRIHKMEKAAGKKINLLDKHGVEWPVTLIMDRRYKRIIFGLGLKDFFKAIDIKANESFVLELVWEEKTNPPMLKFCSKITQSDSDLNAKFVN